MRKMILFAASGLALAWAGTASAQNLTSVTITGPTGTVWDTTENGFYDVFLARNDGPPIEFVNPTGPINTPVFADNRFLTFGDGFPVGTTADSDPLYNLTLMLSNAVTLTGSYTPVGNIFVAGSSVVAGGVTYALTEFSWRRNLGDPVSPETAFPGGDQNDYAGNIRFTATPTGAIPEPGTWAMMLIGFGALGAAMRRKKATTVQGRIRFA